MVNYFKHPDNNKEFRCGKLKDGSYILQERRGNYAPHVRGGMVWLWRTVNTSDNPKKMYNHLRKRLGLPQIKNN